MKQFNYIYIYIHIISFRITLMDLGYLGSRNYWYFLHDAAHEPECSHVGHF